MNASRLLRLAACLLSLLSGPAGAEVYRWTDAAGKLHFSDRKPEGTGQVEAFRGEGPLSIVDSPPAATAPEKLRMFVTQWCPTCKKAKAWLRQRGTPFEELDVETSAQAKAEYDRAGGRAVPLILLGRERMTGFDARRLEDWLVKAGH